MRANKGKKNTAKKNGAAADEPKELSFMRPIEPKADEDADEPKLSRAERRAAKPQVKQHGRVQNMRNQSVPNHRNFSTRRSG